MTHFSLQRIIQICLNDLRLRLRMPNMPGGILGWLIFTGFIGAGYYFLLSFLQLSFMAPFLISFFFLAGPFGSLLIYPKDFKYYAVSGINLRDVFFGKNLSLFLLGTFGAIVCGFGFQWKPSITLQHSISVLLYFGMIIFPFLTIFNYVAVFRQFFCTVFLQMLVFFPILLFASIPYLVCWIYFESSILCLLIIVIEFIAYYFTLLYHIAPLAHHKAPKIVEISNEMYSTG